MSYSVEELNPKNPVLIIDNKEIIISLITLQTEVSFIEQYGSLSAVFGIIQLTPEKIIDIIWELTANKDQFNSSLEVFKKFVLTSKGSIVDWAKDMSACLTEAIQKSMPLIKNQKRQKEIQEIKNSSVDSKPCYATYFDTVAKRYGYTLDQFYELTLRQVHILLHTIGDKQYDELEIQAALQGRKLKPRMVFNDVSVEEEKEQEQQALDALSRLKKEYEERNKDK